MTEPIGLLGTLIERWRHYDTGILQRNAGLQMAARELEAALKALPPAPPQELLWTRGVGYVSDEGDETEDDFPHHSPVDTAGVSRPAVHAAERVSTEAASPPAQAQEPMHLHQFQGQPGPHAQCVEDIMTQAHRAERAEQAAHSWQAAAEDRQRTIGRLDLEISTLKE